MSDHNFFMRHAIELCRKGIEKKEGPFGAVITRNGEILAGSYNMVSLLNDPTAHAEINAIRAATKKLNSFDLSGCEIYTSCEPCPMCLGAIYWARINKIYFAGTREDTKNAGFDDFFIYEEISLPLQQRALEIHQLLHEEILDAFKAWEQCGNKENQRSRKFVHKRD